MLIAGQLVLWALGEVFIVAATAAIPAWDCPSQAGRQVL